MSLASWTEEASGASTSGKRCGKVLATGGPASPFSFRAFFMLTNDGRHPLLGFCCTLAGPSPAKKTHLCSPLSSSFWKEDESSHKTAPVRVLDFTRWMILVLLVGGYTLNVSPRRNTRPTSDFVGVANISDHTLASA